MCKLRGCIRILDGFGWWGHILFCLSWWLEQFRKLLSLFLSSLSVYFYCSSYTVKNVYWGSYLWFFQQGVVIHGAHFHQIKEYRVSRYTWWQFSQDLFAIGMVEIFIYFFTKEILLYYLTRLSANIRYLQTLISYLPMIYKNHRSNNP